MKLMQTLAKANGFRDAESNPVRLAALDRLLRVAREQSAEVVLLPGGFVTASTSSEFTQLQNELKGRADDFRIGLLVGIDRVADADHPDVTGKAGVSAALKLPYFGFALGEYQCESSPQAVWQQTSSTKDNAWDVAEENVPGSNRVVSYCGKRIGLLICGELFSIPARESMANLGLDLVVDLGHSGMGTGVTPAMENIARNGRCAVAHSQHVVYWGSQSLHFVGADGVRNSVPLAGCKYVGDDDFWIGWCVRTV